MNEHSPLILKTRPIKDSKILLINSGKPYLISKLDKTKKGNKRCTEWEERNKTVFVSS